MYGNAIACWWQKDGSSELEYEDAFAVGADGENDVWELTNQLRFLRVAVADGATESMLSGKWAQVLVQSYTVSRRRRMRTCVNRALDRWPRFLQEYKDGREEAGKPIAWYEEPGLERGAHATLLAVEFQSAPDGLSGTWIAEAIGDSCLFQVSDNKLKSSFPVGSSVEFDTSPALVHTGVHDRRLLEKYTTSLSGNWSSGDSFFLCTDALAAWFYAQHESGAEPWTIWREFHSSGDREDFREWVASERHSSRMKNDDVTLVNVQFD